MREDLANYVDIASISGIEGADAAPVVLSITGAEDALRASIHMQARV